jgi:type IV secretion system protein VirB1
MNPAITGIALANLLNACAPSVGERTMHAIIAVETGGHPYEIGDNTAHVSYAPRSRSEAITWADYLLARHHNVDLGIAQINSANLPHLGMSVAEAFDPCKNVAAASQVLMYAYQGAIERFGPGQYALRRAISAYNTGSLYAGEKYVSRVLAAAGITDDDGAVVPDLAPLDAPAAVAPQRLVVHEPPRTGDASPLDSPIMVVGKEPASIVLSSPSPAPTGGP